MPARWRTTTCSTSAAGGWRTPWTPCPVPGCGRLARDATPVTPGGRWPSRCQVAGGWSSFRAGWVPAGSRQTGPLRRTGPASTSCPICPAPPPTTSPAGRGPRGGRVTPWSSPSTGDPTGDMTWTPTRSASPTAWSTAASTSSTATPRITLARSRCSGASSSCTAAATASTITRASPAMRGTGTTCACCTSRRCSRVRASWLPCGWCPCRPRSCGCTAPRWPTRSG